LLSIDTYRHLSYNTQKPKDQRRLGRLGVGSAKPKVQSRRTRMTTMMVMVMTKDTSSYVIKQIPKMEG
jgi:hypothetical protein